MSSNVIENVIETYLRKQCNLRHVLCYKFVSPAKSGVPDRLLIYNGKVWFCETKRPGGRTRALQDVQIAKMRRHGATVYVADTKDKVDAMLDELCK